MTGLAGVNKQPPLKRLSLIHSPVRLPAWNKGPSHESSHRGTEGKGRGDGLWQQSQPNLTTPYRAIPCKSFLPIPLLQMFCFLSGWHCLSLDTVYYFHTRSSSEVRPKSCWNYRSLLSSWLHPHPLAFFLCPRLCPQLYMDLKQITVWSCCKNRWRADCWEGWKERVGTSEEAASYEEAAFCVEAAYVCWCVCLLCVLWSHRICDNSLQSGFQWAIIDWLERYKAVFIMCLNQQ